MNTKTPPTQSRSKTWRNLAVALLLPTAMAGAEPQNRFLVYEDFQSTPLDALPSNFTLTGTAPPTVIGVKDTFGSYLQGRKALRFEDRNAASIPYLKVTSTTAPAGTFNQGWFRVKFIPVDNTTTYIDPRFFFRVRGASNQTVARFQIYDTRLTYYDVGTQPVDLAQFPILNQENDLLVRFDLGSRRVEGELNGVSLTKKAPYQLQPLAIDAGIPAQVEDLELRAGDGATDKSALLIKLVEFGQGPGPAPSHTGTSGRIQVRVSATTLSSPQTFDEAPTALDLNLPQLLSQAGFLGRVRLSSVKVVPAGATGPELPCRWFDRDAPADFPVCVQPLSASSNAVLEKKDGHNFGSLYSVFGDSGVGRLVWMHRQTGNADSLYDILFTTRTETEADTDPAPLKWVGDGSPRFDTNTTTTSPTNHVRVAVTDWDGDGKKDLIFGEYNGLILVMKNVGSPTVPAFNHQDYVRGHDGKPLSVGIGAAPLIVDWNGDGWEDLLVGTHYNHIAWFRNTGSNSVRRFVYEGILKIGSSPLELPFSPNGGNVGTTYTKDYYPVLESADWDGDGDKDLLAGGYVTGKIFWFRNTGTTSNGTPTLASAGEIELHDKNGAPLSDVGSWCAAPTVADLNGDGKLDLVTGRWDRRTPRSGHIVRLFRNDGTVSEPRMVEKDLNFTGVLPAGSLSSPRLADLTGDNLPDLVISAQKNIYILVNTGTTNAPRWAGNSTPIKTPWSNSQLTAAQLLKINADDKPDLFGGATTSLNSGSSNPYFFENAVGIFDHPAIVHRSEWTDFGDFVHSGSSVANIQRKLFDLDRDNKLDFLYADWHGRVWYHRNIGPSGPPYTFQECGTCLTVEGGGVISVDLTHAASYVKVEGGARPVFTVADFNRDGRNDLILGDTFGNVRYFRGAGPTPPANGPVSNPHLFSAAVHIKPKIDPEHQVIEENMRGIDAIDWDLDNDLDVVTGSTEFGSVTVYQNKGVTSSSGNDFKEGVKPVLPKITQPVPIGTDLNADGGAEDLFISGILGSFWIERSFIEHGYAPATVVGVSPSP